MASSDPGKAANQSDPNIIRDRLIDLVARQEFQQLVQECQEHGELIYEKFSEWKIVPENIRQDKAKLDRYANGIITIAQLFAQNGYPELVNMLSGDPDNPLTQWQNGLQKAQGLMSQVRFPEAVQLLSELLKSSQGLTGVGVEKLLAITQGYLGESYFQMGDAAQARTITEQALKLCLQEDDSDGIQAYTGNLYEIYRYLGETKLAADMADKLADLLEIQEEDDIAKRYHKQAKIVRNGEPLNRVVVDVEGDIYEMDEIDQVDSEQINLNFHRNRIALKPSMVLSDQGEDLASAGQYDEALELFQQANKADQYDPHPHYLAGLTLLHLKRYQEAVDHYQKAEQLAPGWYNCRADLWIAQQLASKEIDHEIFVDLHILEDGEMSPADKIKLAEQALEKAPKLAPLYLFYGNNLVAEDRDRDAEAAYRNGLTHAQEPDIKTRLLLQLGSLIDDQTEKKAVLEQAVALNGNLIAAAMAAFLLQAE